MPIQKLINTLRIQASLANNGKYFTSVGIITGYDPNNRLVTVQIHPATDDSPALQTGWIPITSPWIGNNCGMLFAPNVGDIVAVHYQEGSLLNAYADACFYNNTSRPLPVPSGEAWIVHKSGSFIKLTNDGKVSINGQVEIDITTPKLVINVTGDCEINADGTVKVDADTVEIGDTSGALKKLLNETAADVFNTHTHDSGSVPIPDQQMSSDDMTVNTKAT